MTLSAKEREERVAVIIEMLNAGSRPAEIADCLYVSRALVYKIIKEGVDKSLLHIPCGACGEEMDVTWGLGHKYHAHCAKGAN